MKYRAEIDGLRALAVLPVILFHAGFEWFGGGFVGVDVFFVISGYLITTIILNEIEQEKFSIINFYERRARRLLPALFFMMLVCIPFAWFLLIPSDFKDFGRSLFAVPLFASNFLFWWEAGYFDSGSDFKPLLHTWSLAVEEQYYLFAPLFFIIFFRFGIKVVTWALLVIFIISLGLSELWSDNRPTANFYMLFTRAWELIVGAFAAIILLKAGFMKSKYFNQILSIVGLLMVLYAVIFFNEETPFPSLAALVPVIGAFLLVVCSTKDTLTYHIFSFRPLVMLGLISYSLYLWHNPVFVFARHFSLSELSNFVYTTLIMASFILAYLSWKYIESPFRNKKLISQSKIFKFSFVSAIFFCIIGLTISEKNGFYERIKGDIDPKTSLPSELRSKCDAAKVSCEYFGDDVTWATLGDSHIIELTHALALKLSNQNIGVMHNSNAGCGPNLKSSFDSQCSKWEKEALLKIKTDPRIENVVITYRLSKYLYGDYMKNYPLQSDGTSYEYKEEVWSSLEEVFNLLIKSGKKVYFIIQPPELQIPANKLIFWNSGEKFIKGLDREWWEKRNKFIYDRLEDLPDELVIIDPIDLFCGEKYCYVNDQNGYLYTDDHHISLYGAQKLVLKYFDN